MTNEVTVALISASGAGVSSFVGILISSKLTQYRIEQLERKMDKHNKVVLKPRFAFDG
jgi:hypothetical protein